MCSTIAVTFNPVVPFLSQLMCLGTFPICCFPKKKIKHKNITLAVLLLRCMYEYSNWLMLFIEFANKESVLYISMPEYISDACSQTKTLWLKTSKGNEVDEAISKRSSVSYTKLLSLLKTRQLQALLCFSALCFIFGIQFKTHDVSGNTVWQLFWEITDLWQRRKFNHSGQYNLTWFL